VKPPAPLATFWPLDSLPPLTMMTRAAPVEVAGSGWTTCAVEVDVTVTLGAWVCSRVIGFGVWYSGSTLPRDVLSLAG